MSNAVFWISRPLVLVAFSIAIVFSVVAALFGVLQYFMRNVAREFYQAVLFLDGKGRGFVHTTKSGPHDK